MSGQRESIAVAELPLIMPRARATRRKRIVFGWYGGKFSHLDWLLPHLPKAHHYCEPFAGSAAVLLNRDPSPVETYNDVDGDVVNFFRVLRDEGPELQRAIIIRLYDSKSTLFYCDPPYLHDTRGDKKAYGFEMEEGEHIDLASALNRCKGSVAISGYRNKLMDKLYKGWRRFDATPKTVHSVKQVRQECLWMNY